MKTLVIAEKPSVGRDIARVLNCSRKLNGGMEGNNYIVTWGLGHLVTLASPESYDAKLKEWKLEQLPMLPEKLTTEVIKETSKQYGAVKTLLHRNDVKDIIIATDAGREGELVARWILQKAKCNKSCKRLWISSVTDKAIKEGFANLKDAKAYDNLYYAALSRAEADWLVGLNATRALTCRYNASLSCGRVQTPTLAMIAKREEEIKRFVPATYYGITARAGGILYTWRDSNNNSQVFSKDRIDEIYKKVKLGQMSITAINKKSKTTNPPLLYDLTELQREANNRYSYSAKETLNIIQRLYENHKVLTYPRTDSRYITTDVVDTIKDRLRACATGNYKPIAGRLLAGKIQAKPSFVNNAKVSDHHAIIPTEQMPEFSHMTNEEKKIYDLVVKRFIAVLLPAYEYEETTITASIAGESFYAKGNITVNLGYKEVYSDSDEEKSLPIVSKGTVYDKADIKLTEGKTKPPARFNEATLLSAMENPVKYMESDDKAMADTLGATGGLGTVATRADIIEKLFQSFLVEKKGKDIYVTSKGRQLLELVPDDLRKPELTADWEMKLSRIAKGELKSNVFMTQIREYTSKLIAQIKIAEGTYRHDNLTNKVCPQCGKKLLAVNTKNARKLVCQDRECGYRETIARVSNARCPVCHKKMEMTGKGDAETFVCVCGHKERLSKFKERRKSEGAGVSKKDISKYLNSQKDEFSNNPFAEAFAKMNEKK